MIEIANLTKKYDNNKIALSEINLSLKDRIIIGLVGNNSSGKTTLIKTILGYTSPNYGDVQVFGQNPATSNEVPYRTILVDEKATYDPFLSLERIMRRLELFSHGFDYEKCIDIANTFNLPLKTRYSKLSKGKKNQFNIAVGMATSRDIILFDEPVAGLDENARDTFYRLLLKDYLENPRLIIVSTHLLAEIQNLTSRIIVMREGKIVCNCDTAEVSAKMIEIIAPTDKLAKIIANRKIYSENTVGYLTTIILENNLTRNEKKYLEEQNISITPLKANEVCRIICNSDYVDTGESHALSETNSLD